MKRLILQKEFISDLFCLVDSGCPITDDLFSFLCKEFRDYDLLCDFSSYEEYQSAALENPILEAMLDKFSNISYEANLMDKFQKDTFYDQLPERNIFLTDLDVNSCKSLTLQRGYLFISKDNIPNAWQSFFEFKNGINLKVTQSKTIKDSDRLDSWSKVQRLSHPLTSVIIFDKHLLMEEPDNIIINFIPFLEYFILQNGLTNKIYITIISEVRLGKSLKDYHDKIETELKRRGIKNLVINIIRHNKALYPKKFEGLHARFILTNYLNIMPDACINFFDKKGAVVNVANIPIYLNLNGYHNDSFKKDIEDLKTYFSKVNNSKGVNDLKYSDVFYPNKLNPLLN